MTLAVIVIAWLVIAFFGWSLARVAGIHAERERIEEDKRAWAARDELGA